jgi:hypothetical protein
MEVSMKRDRCWRVVNVTLALLLLSFSTALGATIVHEYELRLPPSGNGFNDVLGGPALVPNGGTLTATNYSFQPNQGLSLSSGLPNPFDYSIVTDFAFTTLTNFRKIIDFKNLVQDTGLYNLDTRLDFFNAQAGPLGALTANQVARVVLTRDAASTNVVGYVNGAQQFTFVDGSQLGVASGPNNILHFFRDDNVQQGAEASAGFALRIAIFNGALSAEDVRVLDGPNTPIPVPGAQVPEPGTLLLMTTGIAATFASIRRRRHAAGSAAS